MGAAWERGARAAGAVFVVLAASGFIVAGETPKTSDSAADVVSYFESSRSQVMVGAVLFAVSVIFFVWFAAAVANHLRESGQGRVAATVLAAAAVFAGLQLVLTTLFATLAYSIAGSADPGATKALFDFDLTLDVVGGLAAGLFVLASALGLKRTESIPVWLAWVGVVVAVIEFLRVTTWARDGFWSPSGEYVIVAVVCGLLWILVTSIVLVRGQRIEAAVPGGPATPTAV